MLYRLEADDAPQPLFTINNTVPYEEALLFFYCVHFLIVSFVVLFLPAATTEKKKKKSAMAMVIVMRECCSNSLFFCVLITGSYQSLPLVSSSHCYLEASPMIGVWL